MIKKNFLMVLALLPFSVGLFTACDEVEEVSKYDNWAARNTAFIDSIASLVGDRIVLLNTPGSVVDAYEEGQMFAIQTTSGTDQEAAYVYCKKLTKNVEGRRPYYAETVETYYYGTNILGEEFDGNFDGYSATDQGSLDGADRMPTAFDAPATFSVDDNIISGWTWPLQYMHVGERWMLYVPYQSAYGTSGSGTILGYSALTFDLLLSDVVDEE